MYIQFVGETFVYVIPLCKYLKFTDCYNNQISKEMNINE